jgi:hypothetical protein
VAEIKDEEMNPDSKYDSKNNGKGQIIDTDPTSIVVTPTIQPEEPIQILKRRSVFSIHRCG